MPLQAVLDGPQHNGELRKNIHVSPLRCGSVWSTCDNVVTPRTGTSGPARVIYVAVRAVWWRRVRATAGP